MAPLFSRIHLLTHEYFPKRGGIATTVLEIAGGLLKRGENPCIHAPGQPQAEDVPQVRRMGYRGTESWPARLALHRYWKAVQPAPDDLVWVLDPGPLRAWLYAPVFPRRLPAPLAVTLHGSEIQRLCALPWRRWFFRRFLQHARLIHCLSEFNRRSITRLFPEMAEKVVVTGGAPTLPAEPVERPPRGTVEILSVARIHPRKGQDITLAALAGLPGNLRRGISLNLVGPVVRSGYARVVREQASRVDFPVKFSGELSDADLAAAHHSADIFTLTSRPAGKSVEGLGLVYLNAAATGLPVIATDVGGVGEALLAGQSGLLVPAGDLSALTSAYARLIQDGETRRRMGETGRTWAAEMSWEKVAAAVLSRLA